MHDAHACLLEQSATPRINETQDPHHVTAPLLGMLAGSLRAACVLRPQSHLLC